MTTTLMFVAAAMYWLIGVGLMIGGAWLHALILFGIANVWLAALAITGQATGEAPMSFNDSDFLHAAARSPLIAERRYDRPDYDLQSPGSLRHSNGTLISSLDRAFNNAALRAVYEAWRQHEGAA